MKKKLLITNLVNLSIIILFIIFFNSYTLSYTNQIEYNTTYSFNTNNKGSQESSFEISNQQNSNDNYNHEQANEKVQKENTLSSSTLETQNNSNNNEQNIYKDNNQPSSNQDNTNNQTTSNQTNTEDYNVKNENNFSTSSSSTNSLKSEDTEDYNSIINRNDKLGTLGRLYIPSQNFDVAVYYANAFGQGAYTAQEIVDKVDSAAFYEFGHHHIIADHNYQGFKKIVDLKVGDKAYIKTNDNQLIILRLKEKFAGYNLKSDLVDTNYNSIQNKEESLVMYTCYKEKNGIMITLWEQIN